jgi:serine/threonine protein phosphatase PrpC
MHAKYTKEGCPTLFVIGVFDGHGNNANASSSVAYAYNEQFNTYYDEITQLPFTDRDEFETVLHKICETVEESIKRAVVLSGGSTATIVGVIENGKKRIVFNMNMGDSHAYMRRDGVIQQVSVDHSVDNKEAYAKYCEINLKRGIDPTPAVYNRINCDKLGSSLNGIVNHEGKIEPVPIFDVAEDGISLNIKARDYITRCTEPGGSQSIRQYVGLKNGVTRVLPGYEHVNHGSTLLGDLQFVRGHGDLKQTSIYGFLHIPDINIYSVDPEETLEIVCGSDGLWDLFWTCEVMDVLDSDAAVSVHNIKRLVIERSQDGKFAKKGYRTLAVGLHTKAQWDDVSFATFVSPSL